MPALDEDYKPVPTFFGLERAIKTAKDGEFVSVLFTVIEPFEKGYLVKANNYVNTIFPEIIGRRAVVESGKQIDLVLEELYVADDNGYFTIEDCWKYSQINTPDFERELTDNFFAIKYKSWVKTLDDLGYRLSRKVNKRNKITITDNDFPMIKAYYKVFE